MAEKNSNPELKLGQHQKRALKLLLSKMFVLLYGGRRCLDKDTLVSTPSGYKKISELDTGEYVHSVDGNKIVQRKIVSKYLVPAAQPKLKVITFTLSNNEKIKCSYGHRLRFGKRKYVKADFIARRTMEVSRRYWREIQNIEYGAIGNNESFCFGQSSWESCHNEASLRWVRVSSDNDKIREWEIINGKNAQTNGNSLDSKPRKQTTGQSLESHKDGQQGGKYAVGDKSGKYRLVHDVWSSIGELGRKIRDAYFDRRSSKADSGGFRAESSNERDAWEKIWSKSGDNKGHYCREKLEASEIRTEDIIAIELSDYIEPLYDIEVEYNHNFLITRRNIISHNSGKTAIIMILTLLICNLYDRTKKIAFLKDIIEPARILIVRYKFTDVRKYVINQTLPWAAKVLNIQYEFDGQLYVARIGKYYGKKFVPNGSEIWFGGLDEGRGLDRVLGGEYLMIFMNEVSEQTYSALDTIKSSLAQKTGFKNKHLLYYSGIREWLGVKEGDKDDPFSGELGEMSNRMFFDENPPSKLHWTYKIFFEGINPEDRTILPNFHKYGYQKMSPRENAENVGAEYMEILESMSESKKKRFLYGDFADELFGTLFSESNINQFMVLSHPQLKKTIISVDPAGTARATSDETGIVVLGEGMDGRGYVLEDASGIYTPHEWADKACGLFKKWDADYILAEVNMGWDMVKHTIQSEDKNIPVKSVRATKGKILRADPISFLYADGRISHVGHLSDLEYEMTTYTGAPGEKSPNRLDAMVHGFTSLFPVGVSSEGDIFGADKLKYYTPAEVLPDNSFAVITIGDSKTYMFSLMVIKVKHGKYFVKDILFSLDLPIYNLPKVVHTLTQNNADRVIVECDLSYSDFTQKLYDNLPNAEVRGATMPIDSENRILIESQNIKDNFVFPKSEDEEYKNFLRQLNTYTNLSDKSESFAADLCACASTFIRVFSEEYV